MTGSALTLQELLLGFRLIGFYILLVEAELVVDRWQFYVRFRT